MKLSKRIESLEISATLAVSRKAREMKAGGKKVFNLSAGQPDFGPEPAARAAARAAAEEPFAHYTDSRGILELREAVCARTRKDLGLEYRPEEVVVSPGSKNSLYNLFQVLLDPGDEVLVPVPYWTSYPEMIKLAGGKPVFVPPNDRFKVDPGAIEAQAGPRTRALIINSPNNPSGVVYEREELAAIAEWAHGRDLVVISDDAYQYFIYDDREFVSLAAFDGMREKTVIVGAASKTYSMTGWRLGWFLGPEAIAAAVARLQDQSTSNPCSLSQKAALAALEGDQAQVAAMREKFQARRDFLLEKFSAVPDICFPPPAGAFYFFFGHPAIGDSVEFAGRLLEETGVALVPGAAFGLEGYLRLSYAVDDRELEEATGIVVEALNKKTAAR